MKRENRMKTAMSAALTCALLAPLSASALECSAGQANLTLTQVGSIERTPGQSGVNLSAVRYRAGLNGTSAITGEALDEGYQEESIRLYVSVGTVKPAVALELGALSTYMQISYVHFEPWKVTSLHESGVLRVDALEGAYVDVHISPSGSLDATMNIDVSPTVHADAARLQPGNVRVYMQAVRKADNKLVTVFDTRNACAK